MWDKLPMNLDLNHLITHSTVSDEATKQLDELTQTTMLCVRVPVNLMKQIEAVAEYDGKALQAITLDMLTRWMQGETTRIMQNVIYNERIKAQSNELEPQTNQLKAA